MNTLRKLSLAACAAISALGHAAAAQEVPAKIYVVLENVNEAGVACGLSKERNGASIRAAMRYNRIPEVDRRSSDTHVYVSTQTLLNSGVCFTTVEVMIQSHQPGTPDGMSPVFGTMVYCSRGMQLVGTTSLASRVDANIKSMFDLCLEEMRNNITTL